MPYHCHAHSLSGLRNADQSEQKNDYSPGYSHRLNLLPRSPGEPVRHGDKSSTISRNNISSHQLLATIHAADDATPDGVRKAFIMSIANGYTLAFAPPKPASTVTTVVKRIVHRKQR